MQNLKSELISHFEAAIKKAFPHLESLSIDLTQSKFGHYQCNMAMKLGKELKMNPIAVAKSIIDALAPTPIIEKLDIAGPGFINITLNQHYIASIIPQILKDARLGIPLPTDPKRIVIDFSSPNIAKEMHVGHLRSTIIGDCLARVFEFLGHDVLRLNHVGDWGTSFGMLIAYMKQNQLEKSPCELSDLVTWYKESKKLFDEDPVFKKQSQMEVVALQSGDQEALHLWKRICLISSSAYQKIYDALDISLIERGESFYNPDLPALLQELEDKKLLTSSDGAKCIFLEGFKNRDNEPLPLMLQKSDGGYNYDTTDMAAIKQRIQVEKADRLIYVTDQGQATHFHMIFKAAEIAGYLDPKKVEVDHVGFGLVLGPDGKKLKTRSGDTVKLSDLLDAAIEEAKKILQERNPSNTIDHDAEILGLGAIKYADLSSHRMSDYHFSYEKMLRFEGNTAAFIMYSYVRVLGIKRKIGKEVDFNAPISLNHPSELALGVHLLQFQEALEQLTKELLPNRLTDYLYSLAEKFNAFFRDCRVEGTEEQNSRLLLAEATARTLKQGLELLGIKTLDKM